MFIQSSRKSNNLVPSTSGCVNRYLLMHLHSIDLKNSESIGKSPEEKFGFERFDWNVLDLLCVTEGIRSGSSFQNQRMESESS